MSESLPVASVLIADDHAVVRNGLKDVLSGVEGFTIEVVGEAENGVEAIAISKETQPDLLLLDVGMPLSRGMEVFGEVRRWAPATKVAVVTGFTSAGSLSDWIAAGVDGVFLKSCTPKEMSLGFTRLLLGESYVCKDVVQILEHEKGTGELTLRERQVLHLIAQGFSNAAIAERLSISAKTVDNHRTRMMAKLNVHSVAQMLAYALREGLLDPSSQS